MQECKKLILFPCLAVFLTPAPAGAGDCATADRACVIKMLDSTAAQIDNQSWRDQTYRELAKTQAFEGDIDAAITTMDKIITPDTKAMTIRGIGMAAADNKLSTEEYAVIFAKLRTYAEKIEHPPSYAIALTYIAMAQAFAGEDEGAWKTASEMENESLRHKAYGETAEIQAERSDINAAMKSIGFIESEAYRNKAYAAICKILADRGQFNSALTAAKAINNAYKKAEALQYILERQKPGELSHD